MEESKDIELKEIKVKDPAVDCKLCYRPAQLPEEDPDSLDLGPLYEYDVCRAHHFCLIFSSGLEQKVEEEEGIKGFAPEDIVKEWKRGSYLKCFYCKNKYATVGCIAKGCRKCYHLPCGIENGSLQQFFGNYGSYCHDHRPVQTPTSKPGSKKSKECGICLDSLNAKSFQNLWTPCCGGWFHRGCMRRMANTAGMHFFKCPLCNNSNEFTEEMLKFGIYVPDQDAKWETEDGGFEDLLIRPDSCDASVCLCPQGRSTDEVGTEWETIICVMCGAKGIHIECGGLNFDRPRWKCHICREVLGKIATVGPVSVFKKVKLNSASEDNQQRLARIARTTKFAVKKQGRGNLGWDELQVTVGQVKLCFEPAPPVNIPLPVKLSRDKDKQLTAHETAVKLSLDQDTQLIADETAAKLSTPKAKHLSNLSVNLSDSPASNRKKRDRSADKEEKRAGKEKENQENVQTSLGDGAKFPKGQMTISQFFLPRRSVGDSTKPASPAKETNKRKRDSDVEAGRPNKKLCVTKEGNGEDDKSEDEDELDEHHEDVSDHAEDRLLTKRSSPRKRSSDVTSNQTYSLKDAAASSPARKCTSDIVDVEEYVSSDDEQGPEEADKEKNSSKESSASKAKQNTTGAFVCQYCRMSFSSLVTWKQHETTHKSGIRCGLCDLKFDSHKLLKKHLKEKHTGNEEDDIEDWYKCEECGFFAKSKRGFKIHMARMHIMKGDKQEDCETESVSTTRLPPLSRRSSSASTSVSKDDDVHDAYKCDFCTALFVTRSAVMSHIQAEHREDDDRSEAESTNESVESVESVESIKSVSETGERRMPPSQILSPLKSFQLEDHSDDEVSLSDTMKEKLSQILKDWDDSNDAPF